MKPAPAGIAHRKPASVALWAAFGALLLGVLAWVGAVVVPRERFVARWQDQLEAVADDRSAAVERWVLERYGDARVVAGFPSVIALATARPAEPSHEEGGQGSRAHLESVLASVVRSAEYLNATVLSPDGRVLAVAGGGLALEPAGLDLVRRCLLAHSPLVEFHLLGSRMPVVQFVAPVFGDPSESPVAVVSLLADPEGWLYPFLRRQAVLSDTAETLLVRQEGSDALFLTPLRHSIAQPLTVRRPLSTPDLAAAAALAGRAALTESVDYRGYRVFAVTRPVKGTPWGMVVKVDREEVLRPYHRWLAGTATLIGALAAALCAVAYGLWRRQMLLLDLALARSQARLAGMVDQANDAVFFMSPESRILDANRRACEMYGYSKEELREMSASGLRAPDASSDSAFVSEELLQHGSMVVETTHRRRDGSLFPVESSVRYVEQEGERSIIATVRDTSDRRAAEARLRRLNLLLRTISEIDQLIVRERDQDTLVGEACRVIVEHGEFRMAWIGFADAASGVVSPAARAGADLGYLESVTVRCDESELGCGPTGTAVRERRTVVANGLEADERTAAWREAARAHGFRASAAFPLIANGVPPGALSVYADKAGAFDEEIVGLLGELAQDIAFAIGVIAADKARVAAVEALRDSEEHFRTLAETTSTGIVIAAGEEIVYANAAAARITGFSTEELLRMKFWEPVHPDYREAVRAGAMERLAGGPDAPAHNEVTLLTGTGEERWVSLTSGTISLRGRPALVATLHDVTQERRLRELRAAVYQISEAASTSSSLDDLFRSIHASIGRLMDARNFYIALYDRTTNLLSFPYFCDEEDEPSPPRPLRRGLTEYVLHTGKPLLATPEVFDELFGAGEVEMIGAPSIDWLGVPLVAGSQTIGVLGVQTYTEGIRYGEEEKEVLTYVSRQVAQAIEHKRSERALLESEERYRSLFVQSPIGIYRTTPDGRILLANPALLEILGYASMDELRGRNLEDASFQPGYPRQRFRELLDRDGSLRGFEAVWTRRDGTRIVVEESAQAIRSQDGAVLYYEGVVKDVNERRRAEEALRESEARYRAIFNNVPVGILQFDDQGVITECNEEFVQFIGSSRDALIGFNILKRVKDEGVVRAVLEALAGKVGYYEGDYQSVTSAKVTPTRGFFAGVFAEDGSFVSGVGVFTDETKRRRAEEGQRLLATAVEQSAEVVVITDTSGTIQYVNPAFENLTGYRREEAIGRNPRILKSGKHDDAFYADLWRTISSGGVWSGRLVNKRKDGSTFEEEATISPVRDENGAIVRFVAVKHDVTREVALQEQLNQAQKIDAIGQLAGGVAHDFNNLLQAMVSHAQLLTVAGATPESVARISVELQELIGRGAGLTRQLLLFSRRENSKPESLDLNEVVLRAGEMLRRLVRENIRFALEPTAEPLSVEADRGQLVQVVMNLVLNACDAMSDGGSLTLRTGCGDGGVWLEVEDTGSGIPEEILPRIFEPFFTTKGIGKGTGLGLSVVHGIVTSLGGRVDVRSRVGAGTTLRVELPRAAFVAVPPVEERADFADLPGGRGERILVVEDEESAREGLTEILAGLGYRVAGAGSGEEVRELPNEPAWDLLLTDIVLPGIQGDLLAKESKQRWQGLAVIMMSGYTADEAVRQRIFEGRVHFLQKPFDMGTLARKVRAVLDGIA